MSPSCRIIEKRGFMKLLILMVGLLSSQNIYAEASVSIEEDVSVVQVPQGLSDGAIDALGGTMIVIQEETSEGN